MHTHWLRLKALNWQVLAEKKMAVLVRNAPSCHFCKRKLGLHRAHNLPIAFHYAVT